MASRIYDASAFYAGVPFASPEEGYTTSLVFDEIRHIKQSHGALDTLLNTGRLRILDADSEKTDLVVAHAKKTGDFQKMSKADISAVALALQLGGQLITDDFAVSNLAKNIGLDVMPIMTAGIKKVGMWRYYCPACKKIISTAETCPLCGSNLKRRLFQGESF
ncbi:MAG: nucleotide-binding protein [Candidatus Nitrosotenuis sp.]